MTESVSEIEARIEEICRIAPVIGCPKELAGIIASYATDQELLSAFERLINETTDSRRKTRHIHDPCDESHYHSSQPGHISIWTHGAYKHTHVTISIYRLRQADPGRPLDISIEIAQLGEARFTGTATNITNLWDFMAGHNLHSAIYGYRSIHQTCGLMLGQNSPEIVRSLLRGWFNAAYKADRFEAAFDGQN